MASDPETTWEYKTVQPPRGATMKEADNPTSLLNDLGREGWELVDTIEYTRGGTKYLVFKRPVQHTVDE